MADVNLVCVYASGDPMQVEMAVKKAGIKKGVQAVSMALAIQKKVFKKVAQGVYTLA